MLIAIALATAASAQPVSSDSVRRIYITATDRTGAAVADLTPQEVHVREDGKARDVLAVVPAAEAMRIVLLVDDSGSGIQHVRTGVAEFIRILQRDAEIAIIGTAGQNSVVVDFTRDYDALLG